jgi:hypothetical protein
MARNDKHPVEEGRASFTELLPSLKELSRADKLRAMQFLVFELAKEEDALLKPGVPYPVWSPYESFEAANVLLDALKSEEKPQHDA